MTRFQNTIPAVLLLAAALGCTARVPSVPSGGARELSGAGGEPPIPGEAWSRRAPLTSLADVIGRSDVGPVPEGAAPPLDLLERTLPARLSRAQARRLLLQVPDGMVRVAGAEHGATGARSKRWSRFGTGDSTLVRSSWLGWDRFASGGAFSFYPLSFLSAIHFFPYTTVGGFLYPAYCPFFFSAAYFIPQCQWPVVWFGTFGLVSGCPTCPISGRPLLWFPGEVPVL